MQTEIEKRIEEAAYAYEVPRHFNCYGCCHSDSDYEKAFQAGAKFILELPELREAVEALVLINDKAPWCECMDTANITGDALSKLKALGIVEEGGK